MNRSVRDKIVNNVLNKRSKPFTTAQVAKCVRASNRHTRRVIAELVDRGLVDRLTRTAFVTKGTFLRGEK